MKDITKIRNEIEEKSRVLKALAHPTRLCIVKGLLEDSGCNVSRMQYCLEVPQSTLSQHLSKLKDLGIVEGKRVGKKVKYYVISDEARKVVKALFD
ncbi:ArsR/SmtB family transcription factor [Halothermothrix orenii]|uniref:Regulatory protein ArsR n=1 Tax=Halothermothrix orenii (strain H 168 / OCM 544 / DSM 9562) TaxID=373903 RepID=B8D131_HALOH|nr:metalloregulator ArsR/SmtB family transcription factor [Halothermothrix orenii]ACL69000.1 regulatory protein ArsR [Halothermothrix orenii H 168]